MLLAIVLIFGLVFGILATFNIGAPRFQLGWAALVCLILYFLIPLFPGMK